MKKVAAVVSGRGGGGKYNKNSNKFIMINFICELFRRLEKRKFASMFYAYSSQRSINARFPSRLRKDP